LALGALASAFLMSGHAPKGTVVIQAFQYAPEELTVAPGDTVTWDNEDVFIHTVTADSGAWSSPELRRGQRYVWVPSDTGRFTYHCSAHAIMHGVLVVRR
jgi:plastocyanin